MTRRDMFYDAVDLHMSKHVGIILRNRGMACLYWMAETLAEFARRGIKAVPQAGDASFRIVSKDLDDGKMMTHYSFMWTPEEPISQMALKHGLMPEIHCWVGIPATQEIVDMSIHYLPRCVELAGYKWQMPPPPKYLWVKVNEIPEEYIYHANKQATLFAYEMMKQL